MVEKQKGEYIMAKFLDLEEAVKECEPFLGSKWEKQNDENDNATNFIYWCKNIIQVLDLAMSNEIDTIYAVHRWYNFVTSKMAEELFEQFGAKPENNPKHHEIDFYLKDIGFDLKVTVLPQNSPLNNIKTRKEKNEMIKWLYNNQSQEGRKHLSNKIFILCDAEDKKTAMLLKSNIDKLTEGIDKFINYYSDKPFNQIEIQGNLVYSDIIYIK